MRCNTNFFFFFIVPLWPCWPLCGSFVLVYVWENPPVSGALVTFGMCHLPWFLRYGQHARGAPWSSLESPEVPLELFSGPFVSLYKYQHSLFSSLVPLPTFYSAFSIVFFPTSYDLLNVSLLLVSPLACSWLRHLPFRVSFALLFVSLITNTRIYFVRKLCNISY